VKLTDIKVEHVLWTVLVLMLAPLIFEKKQPDAQDVEENFFIAALL
jgi:hypothetical protein